MRSESVHYTCNTGRKLCPHVLVGAILRNYARNTIYFKITCFTHYYVILFTWGTAVLFIVYHCVYSTVLCVHMCCFAGKTTISNDGATIMKLLDVVHPAAKTLVDISLSQDAEVSECVSVGVCVCMRVCVCVCVRCKSVQLPTGPVPYCDHTGQWIYVQWRLVRYRKYGRHGRWEEYKRLPG